MASTIEGLTDEQAAVLVGLQVGDLLLIQKVQRYEEDEDDDVEDYDEDDGEGSGEGDEDGSDGDGEGADDEGDDAESDSASEASMSDSNGESDDQAQSDDTSATEVQVLPRVFTISAITHDASGNITDIQLVHLKYSSTVPIAHSYQIYGKQVVHDHPISCGQQGDGCEATKIADVVNHQDFQIHAKPNGDLVRRLDQDIWNTNSHTRCITGCSSGFLPHGHNIQAMIANYTSPTQALGTPLPTSYQLPLCPVCVGVDLLKEQQVLQANLMVAGMVEMGDVVEFLGRVNPRRRELGYPFEQFDEREWGFGEFDDMLSDDEGDYDEDGGRWEDWNEAMDPNSIVQNRPASAATIASLPRKVFEAAKQDKEDEVANCKVCLDKFDEGAVLVELPCGHTYYHEECIEQWLKQFDNCPTCRRVVPAVEEKKDENKAAEEGAAEEASAGDIAVEMDGDDTVMSDV
ncbi:hypothetical protein PRZ48_006243 [Zasmidium cellare]|uniref:RING-type domain-containing protein n=1 Tax=Zasmidium cellare TaxID=395010 RepID=A0ABR0EMK7_ZASCE|nr:hypothetical protein PRZ48_006243 [Zasmidium cellare]